MFGRLARVQMKTPVRASVPEYRPEVADQQLRGWSARLSTLASSPASRMYLAQLSALMNYYNKQTSDSTKVSLGVICRKSTGATGVLRSLPRVLLIKSGPTTTS